MSTCNGRVGAVEHNTRRWMGDTQTGLSHDFLVGQKTELENGTGSIVVEADTLRGRMQDGRKDSSRCVEHMDTTSLLGSAP